jgi:hypothetical protein
VTIVGRVLGDEDELANSIVAQPAGLIEDRFDRAADSRALDERDGTERARTAAAIGDLHVR